MSEIKRLSPERTIRLLHKYNYFENQNNDNIVYENFKVGIVLAIDYYGNEKLNIAPYSVKVRIYTDYSSKIDSFYPPLLPVHMLSLPQVGEEVLIILFDSKNSEKGFWISRLNYDNNFSDNNLNQYNLNSLNNKETTKQIYTPGLNPDDLKELYDVEPSFPYKVPKMRIKPGDVLTHGRSNTHVFHTFDTKNKKGIIDIVTEIDKEKEDFYKQEFHISKGARNLLVTKHNIDEDLIQKDMNLKFHNNYNKTAPKSQDESFVLETGDQIRLLSPKGGEINHSVLGEKQQEWLEKLIDLISNLIENVSVLNENVLKHKHMGTGPTSPPLPSELINFTKLITDLKTLKQDINNTKDTIKDHHSKNIGIN